MLHLRMNTRSPEREKEQPIRTRRRCRGAQASFPWRQKQTGALEEWCLRAARSGRVIFTSHQEQTSPEPEPGAPGASNRRKPAAEPPAPTMAWVDYPAQNSTTSSSSPHHKVNTHTHTHTWEGNTGTGGRQQSSPGAGPESWLGSGPHLLAKASRLLLHKWLLIALTSSRCAH